MANDVREGAPREIRVQASTEQMSVLGSWLDIERKLAPGSSPQGEGEIRAVLNEWRVAERSLTNDSVDGPTRAALAVRIAHLRAEYQRLFKAAIEAPPRPTGTRQT